MALEKELQRTTSYLPRKTGSKQNTFSVAFQKKENQKSAK
jgi:hypothetical protein